MKIPVLKRVLERNDHAAAENRARLEACSVSCFNLLGGAGSGKTSILEAVLPRVKESHRVGVLEGDLATTRDARRIAALQVPVVQLLTEGGCHLDASMVGRALDRLDLDGLDLLFVENVGNPICPASFDLGEHRRISVLSVTEGDDKPAKYPLLFKDVSCVLITKCDLLPYTNFNIEQAQRDLLRINPQAEIIRSDIKSYRGVDELARWIHDRAGRPAGAK